MQRQTDFWIGVFCALLVGIPIALTVSGAFEEYALQAAGAVLGFAFGLVLLLTAVTFFRNSLMKRISGQPASSLEEVSDEAINFVGHLIDGDKHSAGIAGVRFSKSVVNLLAWINFYRWVIAAGAALLVVAGSFAGIVLLAEQNSRIVDQTRQLNIQNDLLGVELAGTIRRELETSARTYPAPFLEFGEFGPASCRMSIRSHAGTDNSPQLRRPANGSAIADIARRALGENGTVIQDVLQALLEDDNGAVALSALIILERINVEPDVDFISVDRVYIDDLDLETDVGLEFHQSVLDSFSCTSCGVNVENSILKYARISKLSSHRSVVQVAWDYEDGYDVAGTGNILAVPQGSGPPREGFAEHVDTSQNYFVAQYYTEREIEDVFTDTELQKRNGETINYQSDQFDCYGRDHICEQNPFLSCEYRG